MQKNHIYIHKELNLYGRDGYWCKCKKQDEKNRGAYAMPKTAMEIDTLLSRSQQLAGLKEDENDN